MHSLFFKDLELLWPILTLISAKSYWKGHPNNEEWTLSPRCQDLDYFKALGQFLNFPTVLGCFLFLPSKSVKNFLSTNMSNYNERINYKLKTLSISSVQCWVSGLYLWGWDRFISFRNFVFLKSNRLEIMAIIRYPQFIIFSW